MHVVVNCTLITFAEYHFAVRTAPKTDTSSAPLTPTLPDSSPVHLLHTSWFTFRALCGRAGSAMVQAARVRTARPVDSNSNPNCERSL
jgi:hypothetical protein